MESSFSESYKAAGVDITAGYKSVELMKQHIKRTLNDGCVSDIGGFGGLFQPQLAGMKNPVLVSGTDGVGTTLKVAMLGYVCQRCHLLRRKAVVFPRLYRLR